jgi:hypothetical protein
LPERIGDALVGSTVHDHVSASENRLELSVLICSIADIADGDAAELDIAPWIFRLDEVLQGFALAQSPSRILGL